MSNNASKISKRERRAIFLFALIPSLFAGYLFIDEGIYQYREASLRERERLSGISFSRDWGRRSPGPLLLLVPMIAAALIRPRRFWISTGLTVLFIIVIAVGFYVRFSFFSDMGARDPMREAFDEWDLLFGSLMLVMLGWQLSIIRRSSASRLP